MKTIAVVLAGLVAVATSISLPGIPDYVVQGTCAKIDEARLFAAQKPNHELLGGVWYQAAITENPWQFIKKCVRNEYTYDANSRAFTLWTTGVHGDGSLVQRHGSLKPDGAGQPHLLVDYEGLDWPSPLVFLDTDYANFACIYSCTQHNYKHYSDFSFVFSREPNMNEHYYRRCMNAFKSVGVNTDRFVRTEQGNTCHYDKQLALRNLF